MENLLNSAEIVTSNRIYSQISRALAAWVQPQNALLLVPSADSKHELQLADVIGQLPGRQRFADLQEWLGDQAQLRTHVSFAADDLQLYQHLVNFKRPGQRSHALFLYSGPPAAESAELLTFISRTAHLLKIKEAFDSLPVIEAIQSKLKYQLSFFANAINNIFEPYPPETLAQLYMEIVSEMFLLPGAVTLENQAGRMTPVYAKGQRLERFAGLKLDGGPFLRNQDLRKFPVILERTSPEHIGTENYELLKQHGVKLIMPLSSGDELRYLIAGISSGETAFDAQDQLNLLALGNTLNHALDFAHIQASLLEQTRQLDRRVFSLSALYQAAATIISARSLEETMQNTLDMIMEIFQSAVSTVFVRRPGQDGFELLRIKSALARESLQARLEPGPGIANQERRFLFYRDNSEDRDYFQGLFPEFAALTGQIQPLLIVQLFRHDSYLGFITLSDRVTGESYDQETLKMLGQLVSSVSLAIDNAFMHARLEEIGKPAGS